MGSCFSTNPSRDMLDTSNGAGITANIHLPPAEDQGEQKVDIPIKRRALLVGISYSGPHNTWSRLDGPYDDVDRYHGLLISA
jgi:hypothetical protein